MSQAKRTMKLVQTLLRLCGLHPDQKGLQEVLTLFTLVGAMGILVPIILELVLNWDGVETIKRLDIFPTSIMFPVRVVVMWYNKPQLRRLFRTMEDLWSPSAFDEQTQQTTKKIFNFVYKLIVNFFIFGFILLMLYVVIILSIDNRVLVFKGYNFCDYNANAPCWAAMSIWQLFIAIVQIQPTVLGFDYLFLCVTTHLYVAGLLLAEAFKRMTPETTLKHIVDQHNVMLRCVRELDDYCSLTMSLQFLCSLAALTSCLYMMTAAGMPPSNTELRYFIMYVWTAMELLLYALPATLFYDQLQSLALDAYDVAWYAKGGTKLRRDLAFVIMRIQTMPSLRLSKMIDLNLPLMISIMRTSVSIYTLLKQMS